MRKKTRKKYASAKKAVGKKTTIKKTSAKQVTYKICQKCGNDNSLSAVKCINCGASKFAPEYIRKLEKVNRNTFVQVTLPMEGDGERITLYKWWPGGRSSFNINNIEQWEKIRDVIETKLISYLGWESKEKIIEEIKAIEKTKSSPEAAEKKISKLTKAYPDLIRKILKEVDFAEFRESNYEDFAEIIKEITELLSKSDAGFRNAFREVVTHLPTQPQRVVEDLGNLLKTWSLKQITSISHQVIDRLETLNLFKERILDDTTYEIRGENSIHRILERAMWIIDERYWLMHSNETLRNIVSKELTAKEKLSEKQRPDFVCGSVGNKLIIIELKRPSHELKVEDLNQLENYLSIIESNYDLKTFEAYLVGRKISDELKKRIKYRGGHFKLLTFADLIDDTEKRYKEFMSALSPEKQIIKPAKKKNQ